MASPSPAGAATAGSQPVAQPVRFSPPAAPQRQRRIRMYDFRRPDKFNKDHLRTLSMVYDNYTRLLATVFAASLRTSFQVSLASVDQMTYGEFTRGVEEPAVLALFGMAPLKGTAALVLEPNVAFPMLDRLLGGPGQTVDKARSLTEIEQTVMERLFRNFLQYLGDSWDSIEDLQPKLEGLESNPLFAQIAGQNDICVSVTLSVQVGEHRGGMSFCFPYLMLEPIMPKLSARNWFTSGQRDEQQTLAQSQERLVQAAVTLVAELGMADVTVGELITLEPGDVIRLDRLAGDELAVKIGGRTKFSALAGTAGGRMALRLTGVAPIREDDEDV